MPVRRSVTEGIIVYKDRFCIALGRIEYYFRITASKTIKLRAAMTLLARVFVSAIVLIAASSARAATFEELAAQADAAREADHIPQAIQLYQEALKLKPAWPDGWWYLGTIFYDGDQYEDGRKAFAEFVKLEDNAAPGWAFLGLCESETGDYTHALEHIRRGLGIRTGIEPDTEQVIRFHEALLLTRTGLFDQASPRFMPFVRRGAHDPTLIARIGFSAVHYQLLFN